LLTQEASGDPVALSLLMVHGQNHLITAITFKDMANEIIADYSDLGCQTFRIDDASWL